ncbi:hypothetical protein [Streptomyces mobaraensis]|uniref:hypothetical protein n=1 Tax=Streptomyces mobaraensis TaxID=35621 RepID=UPI001CCB6004|nr:hypothetical protein [Streptomyces mobaraensis]UBI36333.1 hypothetical protein K7I03_07560 [Streptomyces mobaraensis]
MSRWGPAHTRPVLQAVTAALVSLLLVLSGGDPALAVGDRGREERSASTEFSASDDRTVDAVTPEDTQAGVQRRQRTGRDALAPPFRRRPGPSRRPARPHVLSPGATRTERRPALLR